MNEIVFAVQIVKTIFCMLFSQSKTLNIHISIWSNLARHSKRGKRQMFRKANSGKLHERISSLNNSTSNHVSRSIFSCYQQKKQIISGSPPSEHFFITFIATYDVEHTCRSFGYMFAITTAASSPSRLRTKKSRVCVETFPRRGNEIYGKSKWNQKLNGTERGAHWRNGTQEKR